MLEIVSLLVVVNLLKMAKSKHRKTTKYIKTQVGKCLVCRELTVRTEILTAAEKKYSYYLCGRHERTDELKQSVKDLFDFANEG